MLLPISASFTTSFFCDELLVLTLLVPVIVVAAALLVPERLLLGGRFAFGAKHAFFFTLRKKV